MLSSGSGAAQLELDIHGQAVINFEKDMKLARSFGIKGFPSILFSDANQQSYLLYGVKPYEEFEQAILNWNPAAVKTPINTNYFGYTCKRRKASLC